MARSPSTGIRAAASKAKDTVARADGPSPNPMTNLVLTDIALRGGGQLLRHAVERALLSTKYDPVKAKKIVAGRTLTETLISTALARVATRSVPGAILVGGGLLAKTLFDRRRGKYAAKVEGEKAIQKRVEQAEPKREADH